MIKLLILQLLLLVVFLLIKLTNQLECNCRLGGVKKRIIGGHIAPANYIPWMATIFYSGQFICGALIVNQITVATSAHCLFKVVIGVNSIKNIDLKYIYQVNDIIIHPKYDVNSSSFNGDDIGFLKIKPIKFEKGKIEVGCLSFQNSSIFSELMISGFGSTSPIYVRNGLRTSATLSTELKYVLYKELPKNYNSGNEIILAQSLDSNSSTCSGDSGSPVHTNLNGKIAVVGLNSFGIYKNKFDKSNQKMSERCVGKTGFCRLAFEKEFIEKNLKNDFCLI